MPEPVREERFRWSDGELQPAALGLESLGPLFERGAALSPRQRPLEESPGCERVAFPLPGSPDARGNLTGRPGPLGTGWLWLTRYRGAPRALLWARFTPPRSASLAEREWNLLCHLRAHGVGTPEPLLVGARGNGLVSSCSFLLVRAPEDAFPLPRWLRTDGHGPERARGLEALGRALARLRDAGVRLAGLRPDDLWITPSGSGECETEGLGLRKNKLPGVTLVEVRGARLAAGRRARRAAAAGLGGLVQALSASCTPDERTRLAALAGLGADG